MTIYEHNKKCQRCKHAIEDDFMWCGITKEGTNAWDSCADFKESESDCEDNDEDKQ